MKNEESRMKNVETRKRRLFGSSFYILHSSFTSTVRWRMQIVCLARGARSLAALFCALALGCSQSSRNSQPVNAPASADQSSGSVTVVKPERATLHLKVQQPGYCQAFEQTPIFSKIPGYVRKWQVDIGDPVNKDDVLVELWVPEMEVELKQKVALVQQAEAEIKQANETANAAAA